MSTHGYQQINPRKRGRDNFSGYESREKRTKYDISGITKNNRIHRIVQLIILEIPDLLSKIMITMDYDGINRFICSLNHDFLIQSARELFSCNDLTYQIDNLQNIVLKNGKIPSCFSKDYTSVFHRFNKDECARAWPIIIIVELFKLLVENPSKINEEYYKIITSFLKIIPKFSKCRNKENTGYNIRSSDNTNISGNNKNESDNQYDMARTILCRLTLYADNKLQVNRVTRTIIFVWLDDIIDRVSEDKISDNSMVDYCDDKDKKYFNDRDVDRFFEDLDLVFNVTKSNECDTSESLDFIPLN